MIVRYHLDDLILLLIGAAIVGWLIGKIVDRILFST